MSVDPDPDARARHLRMTRPSPWVARFAHLIPKGGAVLDLACGGGRHARFLTQRGHPVTALDRDTTAMAADASLGIEIIAADLETGGPVFDPPGPLAGRRFAGIVVVNYLHRPLFAALLAALAQGGVLIYETFAKGNESFSRPRNPDHLLKSGELLEIVRGKLHVVAYEHGLVEGPDDPGDIPGVKQRLAAVNNLGRSPREDGEPEPCPLKG